MNEEFAYYPQVTKIPKYAMRIKQKYDEILKENAQADASLGYLGEVIKFHSTK